MLSKYRRRIWVQTGKELLVCSTMVPEGQGKKKEAQEGLIAHEDVDAQKGCAEGPGAREVRGM